MLNRTPCTPAASAVLWSVSVTVVRAGPAAPGAGPSSTGSVPARRIGAPPGSAVDVAARAPPVVRSTVALPAPGSFVAAVGSYLLNGGSDGPEAGVRRGDGGRPARPRPGARRRPCCVSRLHTRAPSLRGGSRHLGGRRARPNRCRP